LDSILKKLSSNNFASEVSEKYISIIASIAEGASLGALTDNSIIDHLAPSSIEEQNLIPQGRNDSCGDRSEMTTSNIDTNLNEAMLNDVDDSCSVSQFALEVFDPSIPERSLQTPGIRVRNANKCLLPVYWICMSYNVEIFYFKIFIIFR
jgi:hypothetical protein